MKNKYLPTALALYMNYFVHGFGVIILAQNMAFLAHQWGTTAGGVAIVISSLGIGRIINLLASGILSDHFGRKPFILLGIGTYLVFFVGILLSRSMVVAYILGIIAGMANSFLDSGTYPALMEIFPSAKGTANVVLKAFISGGQFVLPLIVSFLITSHLWFGWSFVVAAAILCCTGVYMLFGGRFPDIEDVAEEDEAQQKASVSESSRKKANLWLDGTLFVIYGYVSQATFYLVSQWLSRYGRIVGGMGQASAHALISYYSVGSITCVLLTAVLAKKIKEVNFLSVYTLISFIALLLMYLIPRPVVLTVMSFVVGFAAAGGVMQLGLTVMSEFFPTGKGSVTGFFYTSGSIASFTIPLFTGLMSSLRMIMFFDVVIALIGFIVTTIITLRYRQLFGKKLHS